MNDSGMVHYNYPLMQGIATQIAHCGQVQQALLDAGVANKGQMLSHFQGTASQTFEISHQRFEQVSHNIIEITARGSNAYLNGTEGMQHAEQQQSMAFP